MCKARRREPILLGPWVSIACLGLSAGTPLPRPVLSAAVLVCALALAAATAGGAAAARPLETALYLGDWSAAEFARARTTGTTAVRLGLAWSTVAPTRPPTRADGRNPGYSGYRWQTFDLAVARARARGLDPIVTFLYPPRWAAEGPPQRRHGPWNVDVAALRDFTTAAATRYSGRFGGLPRVRAWMAWNEPNLGTYLNPQFVGGRPASPAVYRRLLNAFADAVRGVRRDNLVVAGGTAPFTAWTPDAKRRWGMGPLLFMRTLLCLNRKLQPTCSARVKFDVWAHHPYTTGGPFRRAHGIEDVSLGDLPRMREVLDAAARTRRVVARMRPQFWVTEFSWDTKPPDPGGVPLALHARWTSEALYQMWRNGVSRVVWLQLRDLPYPREPFQSGLYFRSGRAKPALQAFRFPFVAYLRPDGVDVWGRTPFGRPARIVVERRAGARWQAVATLRTDRHGIFERKLRVRPPGPLRARLARPGGSASRAFSLTQPADRRFFPFGDWRP